MRGISPPTSCHPRFHGDFDEPLPIYPLAGCSPAEPAAVSTDLLIYEQFIPDQTVASAPRFSLLVPASVRRFIASRSTESSPVARNRHPLASRCPTTRARGGSCSINEGSLWLTQASSSPRRRGSRQAWILLVTAYRRYESDPAVSTIK